MPSLNSTRLYAVDVPGRVRAQADDHAPAALQMGFEPGRLVPADGRQVGQEHDLDRGVRAEQVAEAGVLELPRGEHADVGRALRRPLPVGKRVEGPGRNPLARSSGSGDGLPLTTMTGIVSRTVTASDRRSSSRRASSPARTWRTYWPGSRNRFCLSSGKVTVTEAFGWRSTSFCPSSVGAARSAARYRNRLTGTWVRTDRPWLWRVARDGEIGVDERQRVAERHAR